jgi:hypothetical protein
MNDLKSDFRAKTVGYLSAALGLVAGLAWNDAIKLLIDTLFPVGQNTIIVKFLYAIIVTIAVIVLLKYIEKFLGPVENK